MILHIGAACRQPASASGNGLGANCFRNASARMMQMRNCRAGFEYPHGGSIVR